MEKTPFSEIEPLIRSGKLGEAAAALKKLAAAGGEPWEIYLWMGRIEERRASFTRAEDLFLRSLAGGPPAGAVEMEYGRLLERLGRLDEAAAMFRKGLASGGRGQGRRPSVPGALGNGVGGPGQAREFHMALGRLCERMKRPEDAQTAFRAAAAADPASALPYLELARVLDAGGRIDEARAALRECTGRLKAEMAALARRFADQGPSDADGARFFDILEIAPCREAFLAEVASSRSEARRVEAALRAVLKADPRSGGARTLLAELLIKDKRYASAQREAALAFGPGLRGGQASRPAPVLKLVEEGRYGPGLEKAVLSTIRSRGAADSSQADWYQVFSALLCRGGYRAAFRLGEAMLDKPEPLGASHALLWPWWRKVRRAVGEQRFCSEELERIRAARRKGGFPHWFAYCSAILLSNTNRFEDALVEHRHIRGLDPARYAWMSQPFILAKLLPERPDYDGVIEICRAILERSPGHWWVRCRMAEAHLAKGELEKGLAALQEAEDASTASARGETLTWHGEVLLWLGRYREAFKKLDEAVRLGDKTFVFGWRGGASLKLGDLKAALEDFDRALELDPKDVEAHVWRGEALRLLGRHAEAVQELDRFIGSGPRCLWGYFNRGLARDALGDVEGMRADFLAAARIAELAPQIEFIGRRARVPPADALAGTLSPASARRFMKAGLELAKGVRRWESYVQRIWMRSP